VRPDDAQVNRRLLELLVERSFAERDVVLASGKRSNFYVDCRETALHPEGAYLIGRAMLARLAEGDEVRAVAGVTVGGDPLVTAVAVVGHLEGRPLPAMIVRKEQKGHGVGGFLVGAGRVEPGTPVALLEDVVTTGGSVIRALERLEQAGYPVRRVLALVDREEGGAENLREAGHTLEALYRRRDFPLGAGEGTS